MSKVDVSMLYSLIDVRLSPALRDRTEMKVVGESGLSARIDGEKCLTSIGVWPNGCCDVDFLFVSPEKGGFKHFEFECTEEAATQLLSEIRLAVERA